jgi:ketosteroid isomerase-like protein
MSFASADAQHTERTLRVVREFAQAFNEHAVDRLTALMTDDCVFENTHPKPDGARLEGAPAITAYWQWLFQVSPQAHFAVEELFGHADRAVVRWRYTWCTRSGTVGCVRGVDLFRVQNGQVTEKLSYVKG